MPPSEAIRRLTLYKSTGIIEHRNAVIEGSLGMLVDLANEDRFNFDNISRDDRYQEAVIGFTIGLERYNPERKHAKYGPAKPANYARKYAEGAILAFIRVNGHNIPIPDNCHRAYKLMQERMESAIHEHETEYIDPLLLIDDCWSYQQHGALSIMGRGYVEPDNVEVADFNSIYTHADLSKVLHQLSIIPEPQQGICRAYFGLSDVSMKEICKTTGFSEDMIERIVKGCIRKMRTNILEQRSDYTPTRPKERMFFSATQAVLFVEPKRRGVKKNAPKKEVHLHWAEYHERRLVEKAPATAR